VSGALFVVEKLVKLRHLLELGERANVRVVRLVELLERRMQLLLQLE
tara:strand:- start:70 stop:210 length:141 start_codon:yes stop_codon:yes gene_type:complete